MTKSFHCWTASLCTLLMATGAALAQDEGLEAAPGEVREYELELEAEPAEDAEIYNLDLEPTTQPAPRPATAEEREADQLFATGLVEEDFYTGGRGLITIQGMSGMFLNPTSGTLGQGQLTVQWCTVYFDQQHGRPDIWGNGLMGAYGVTDWLEVGGFGLFARVNPVVGDTETLSVGGPFARVRLLKDEGWMPEVSVGGIHLDGDKTSDAIARSEVFAAASKYFEIDEDGFIRGVRVHGGVRQIWRPERPAGPHAGTVGYLGGELALPYDFYLVGEFSNKDEVLGDHLPFAGGVQWRPNEVLGVSAAAMQPGNRDRISLYVGVAFNYEF